MKKVLDKFSTQAEIYKKYRPVYPADFYDELLKITPGRENCWDCGTGNGQVAIELSKHFKNVYATDISEKQLKLAERKSAIFYSEQRSEKTDFKDNTFDLITVAQAIHWFDFDAFYKEAIRVSRNNAIIAIWGYGLLKINLEIDSIINTFYTKIIAPYWNDERKHIDSEYEAIGFIFPEIILHKSFEIKSKLNLSDLEGYFNSWSSVQNYKNVNYENPVDSLINEIKQYWDSDELKTVTYSIFTKIGRINKFSKAP